MSVNAKQLKKQLTLADYKLIEEKLGLRKYSECSSQTIFYNADAHSNFNNQKPKLYAYRDNNIYLSYTKGCSYDIFGLIQAVKTTNGETCSFVDAVNFVLNLTGYTVDTPTVSNYRYDWSNLERFIKIKKGEAELKIYDDSILEALPKIYPQEWIEEGISIDTMDKYGIAYYPRLQATTIPCRDKDGQLVGIRCRHWLPEEIEKGKYRPLQLLNNTIYKFPTNKIFYGINYNWAEIERTKTATVVESEKAVMQLDTWYHEKNTALGMFGNNLSLTQKKELLSLGVNRVIYVVDNDWIGRDKDFFETWKSNINNFINAWKGYAQVEIIWDNLGLLNPKENATDHNLDTWEKLYESREIITE